MAYTGLYNANGRRRVVLVSGLTSTGMYNADGSYNGVASSGGTYIGATHPCGALNVTIATTIQTTAEAPDGSYYIYSDISGYVLGSIGSSGTVTTLPAWVINQSNPPTIAIDWMNNRAYNSTSATPTAASVITCSRSSTSDYVNNAAGVWSTVAANTPRISDLGLLVEESRTNSITNNSMQGAVIGTPGTIPTNWGSPAGNNLSIAVVSVATQNGIDVIDIRLFGTPNATGAAHLFFEGSTQVAALQNQVWSSSAFLAVSSGGTTNFSAIGLTVLANNSGGAGIQTTVFDLLGAGINSTLTRYSNVAQTLSGATTAFANSSIRFAYTNGSPVDITLRVGWPQLELGASVTSPIRTTAAAATRAADAITLTTPPVFGAAYTLYAKGTPQALAAFGNSQTLLEIDDGTGNNREILARQSATGNSIGNSISGGSNTVLGNTVSWSPNTSGKEAQAVATGDQAFVFNGSSVSTGAGALPINVNVVRFGTRFDGLLAFNGFLEASAIWASQRVPNAQLQSMTT